MIDFLNLKRVLNVQFVLILDVDELSDVDVRYLFFDHILHKCNVFHEYNFENVKGAKPTG